MSNYNENENLNRLDKTSKNETPKTGGSFDGTGATASELMNATNKFVEMLTGDVKFNVKEGFVWEALKADRPHPKYPVVVIINGVGATGKNTFIDNVSKVCATAYYSTIDAVKKSANVLINHEAELGLMQATQYRDEKDDSYRSFLNAIKTAWTEYTDGPNVSIVEQVRNIISYNIENGEWRDIIFVDCREPENIEKIRAMIANNLQLIVLTVLIKGINSPEDYTNPGDRSVYDFDYDIVINNTYGELAKFQMQAYFFGGLFNEAQDAYGLEYAPNIIYSESNPIPPSEPKAIG